MDRELESRIRATAESLRVQGVYMWDRELRSSSLDPSTWSRDSAWDGKAGDAGDLPIIGARMMHRSAPFQTRSFDEATNSIAVTWTTGAAVIRDNGGGNRYTEVLVVTPQAIRLDRLNASAPLLNSHQNYDLSTQLGTVIPGSARVAGGKGVCRVALSEDPTKAGVVGDIRSGKIKNVSVGYTVHAWRFKDEASDDDVVLVTDWEPLEISAVTIPADVGAQFD